MVPVLLTDGKVIPDSTAILEWLEDTRPEPALLPRSEKDRAQVSLWEELAIGVLGPQARTLINGRLLRSSEPEMQKSGTVLWSKVWALSIRGAAGQAHGQAHPGEPQGYVERATIPGWRQIQRADLTTACMLILSNLRPMNSSSFRRQSAGLTPSRWPAIRRFRPYLSGAIRCTKSTAASLSGHSAREQPP